jgi:hypothetical protein
MDGFNQIAYQAICKVSPDGEQRWAKYFPDWNVLEHSGVNNVVADATNDGGLAAVFYNQTNGTFTIAKINSSGNISWSKRFTGIDWFSFQPAGLAVNADGDILVLGGAPHYGNTGVLRFDGETGERIGMGTISMSRSFTTNEIEPTDDGGYLVVGSLERSGGHFAEDLSIAKFNESDELEWFYKYQDDLSTVGLGIYEMDDSYVIVGDGYFPVFYIRINKDDGLPQKVRTYQFDQEGTTNGFFRPTNKVGNTLYFSGTYTNPRDFSTETFLGSLDLEEGDWNWAMARDNERFIHPQTVRFVYPSSNNSLVAFHSEQDIIMHRMEMEEDQPHGGCDWAYNIEMTYNIIDGTIPRGGWPVGSANFSNIGTVNTSTAGIDFICDIQDICADEEEEEQEPTIDPFNLLEEVVVAPNPTAGEIRISLPGKDGETILANLYDMSGRLLNTFSQQIDGYWTLDLSYLMRGTYIMQIKVGDEQFTKKIVKIEE